MEVAPLPGPTHYSRAPGPRALLARRSPELGGPRTPIAALRVDERLASPQMIDPATMTKVIRARFRSAAEELIIRDFVRSASRVVDLFDKETSGREVTITSLSATTLGMSPSWDERKKVKQMMTLLFLETILT
jgi:hypothetical protein